MAAPTPNGEAIPISLSVSDPLSADAQAILAFGTAACTFLSSPAGQQLVFAQLAAGAKIEDAVERAATHLYNLVHRLLHGGK